MLLHEQIQGFKLALNNLEYTSEPMEGNLRMALTQALGEVMSTVSEFTWAAGWYSGIEEKLPPVVRRMRFRQKAEAPWLITPMQTQTMLTIADRLGHWAKYDSYYDCFMPFVPQSDIERKNQPRIVLNSGHKSDDSLR